MLSSVFFIVNSRIGDRRIAEFTRAMLKHIVGIKHEVHLTEYGGHALELARFAVVNKCSLIVAVGGDGTINEVLQAVVHSSIPLAIIPTGSGNGLARHCGIPIRIDKAVELIIQGHLKVIDIGKANETYFISNAGVGFDAYICNQIKQTNSRGLKMYIREVVKNYFTYQANIYSIRADEQILNERAYFLNIANGKEFGYGFQIAPDASLQDGMLDMILVKKINLFNGAKFVWDGWHKNLVNNKDCIYIKANKIVIEADNLKFYQTDGDAHECKGLCTIEICKGAIQLLVPRSIENL